MEIYNKSNLKQTVKFCWNMAISMPFFIILLLILNIIWGLENSILPYAQKIILDNAAKSENIDFIKNLTHSVFIYLLALSIFSIVDIGCKELTNIKIIPLLHKKITTLSFAKLLKQNYLYHQNNLSGSLIGKINDLEIAIPQLITISINSIFFCLVSISINLYTLSLVNITFTFVIIGWLIVFCLISLFTLKKSINASGEYAEYRSKVTGTMVNVLANIIPIKLFARFSNERSNFNLRASINLTKETKFQIYYSYFFIYTELSFVFIQSISLYLLITYRAKGLVNVGDFALILTINYHIIYLLWNTSKDFLLFIDLMGKASQALQYILQEPTIKDSKNAVELIVTQGEIIFDQVSFDYDGDGSLKKIFDNLSVTIKAGEKIGLVGHSGSGKSTFINLILRFFDIEYGAILIDGQNIKNITGNSLYQNIGVIPQNPTLFNRSIMENIRYGKLEASDEEVMEAAKKASIHEFIMSLPYSYHTVIDEHSSIISGGQKQRIAIARVILKDAPILIMDEATSALDNVTEEEIKDFLHKFMEKKTTLIIAHRLSTLSETNRILVFNKGKIVEDGTQEELIELGGIYNQLWRAQYNDDEGEKP